MKIGIFGGSFNPVHNAHVSLVKKIMDNVALDKIIVIPTNIAPHKNCNNYVDSKHRFNMCLLAFKELDFVEVSDLEIKKDDVSYTFETLKIIQNLYPNSEFYLIIGADMYMTLESWNRPDVICDIADIITVQRNEDDYTELTEHSEIISKMGAKTYIIDDFKRPESSTEVRKRIKSGEDFSELVPKSVKDYIIENNLYR